MDVGVGYRCDVVDYTEASSAVGSEPFGGFKGGCIA